MLEELDVRAVRSPILGHNNLIQLLFIAFGSAFITFE